ncbi:hypothetical protein DEO72_LG9g1998 [Vigna unguiculata]|uniref:Uncharacterized protein n=1 Tax=Vigna unguiculata TaxID=3917 RepID=A0A4D6MZP2_VIGUN|nr:hypothetical protein DEO72_LG9g1998 [Vigna unguiculata]
MVQIQRFSFSDLVRGGDVAREIARTVIARESVVAVTDHAGGCWNVGVHYCCGWSCGGFQREGWSSWLLQRWCERGGGASRWLLLCERRGAVVLMVTGASPAMVGHGGRKRRRLPWRLMVAARV